MVKTRSQKQYPASVPIMMVNTADVPTLSQFRLVAHWTLLLSRKLLYTSLSSNRVDAVPAMMSPMSASSPVKTWTSFRAAGQR